MTDTPLLAVRATVNLPWTPVHSEVLVDPTLPHVAAALEAQFLVPLDADQQPGAQSRSAVETGRDEHDAAPGRNTQESATHKVTTSEKQGGSHE